MLTKKQINKMSEDEITAYFVMWLKSNGHALTAHPFIPTYYDTDLFYVLARYFNADPANYKKAICRALIAAIEEGKSC